MGVGAGTSPPFLSRGVPGRQVSGDRRQAAATEPGRSHVGLAPLLRKGRVLTGGCHLESDRRGSPGALGRKPPIRRWMTLRGPAASALQLGSALELGSAEAIWAKLRGGDCRSSTQASCPARPSCGSPELSEDTSWATPMSKPQSLLTLSGPLCRFQTPSCLFSYFSSRNEAIQSFSLLFFFTGQCCRKGNPVVPFVLN